MWRYGVLAGCAAFLFILIVFLPNSIAYPAPVHSQCKTDSDCGDPACWNCLRLQELCVYDIWADCTYETVCDDTDICTYIETAGTCEGACVPNSPLELILHRCNYGTYCSDGACVSGPCSDEDQCYEGNYYTQSSCGKGGCVLPYWPSEVADIDTSEDACDCYYPLEEHWAISSLGDVATTTCCGDDKGEYYKYRKCEEGCTGSASDDACCDSEYDCVYSGTCRPDGYQMTISGETIRCYLGVWRTSPPKFVLKNSAGSDLLSIGSDGYMWIGGMLKATFSNPSGNGNFIIQNSAGTTVFWVDGSTGDVYKRGGLYGNTAATPSSSGNFVINSYGDPVAWITSGGDIYLRGVLLCGEAGDLPECGTFYDNCGGTVTKTCGPNQHCSNGQCICDFGFRNCQGICNCYGACCGGECVDLHTDPDHCGSCSNSCPYGALCEGGVCDCLSGGWLDCDIPPDGICDCSQETHICVGGSCAECFLPGTRILMADGGLKSIEDIESGDVVISYNDETGEITESRVEELLVHTKENRVVPNDGYYVLTTADGQEARVTGIHLLYAMKDGSERYEPVQNLEEGEHVLVSQGDSVKWSKIVSLKFQKEELGTVYNLKLASPNNYFAEGILAHNAKAPVETPV